MLHRAAPAVVGVASLFIRKWIGPVSITQVGQHRDHISSVACARSGSTWQGETINRHGVAVIIPGIGLYWQREIGTGDSHEIGSYRVIVFVMHFLAAPSQIGIGDYLAVGGNVVVGRTFHINVK